MLMTANAEFLERTGMGRQLSAWGPRTPILWTDDFASLWDACAFKTSQETCQTADEPTAI